MRLLVCKPCKGSGSVVCNCSSHPCPGTTTCYDCDGKGKVLDELSKKKKKQLQKLLEYK